MSPDQPADRNLALELVRVTEAAAMAAAKWQGRGDKNSVDQAAVDAMRHTLSTIDVDGVVIIGEGEKDEAPMLFNGEIVGNGREPRMDVAVDPIDGTRLCALGMPGALAVIAMADSGSMYAPGSLVYMEKIAVGEEAAGMVDINAPVEHNLAQVAKAKKKDIDDVTAVILDRPRNDEYVRQVRAAGARIALIGDGDISGAISTAKHDSGIATRVSAISRSRSRTSVSGIDPMSAAMLPASAVVKTCGAAGCSSLDSASVRDPT